MFLKFYVPEAVGCQSYVSSMFTELYVPEVLYIPEATCFQSSVFVDQPPCSWSSIFQMFCIFQSSVCFVNLLGALCFWGIIVQKFCFLKFCWFCGLDLSGALCCRSSVLLEFYPLYISGVQCSLSSMSQYDAVHQRHRLLTLILMLVSTHIIYRYALFDYFGYFTKESIFYE